MFFFFVLLWLMPAPPLVCVGKKTTMKFFESLVFGGGKKKQRKRAEFAFPPFRLVIVCPGKKWVKSQENKRNPFFKSEIGFWGRGDALLKAPPGQQKGKKKGKHEKRRTPPH